MKYIVPFTVNGEKVELAVEASDTLAHVLRDQLHLTGVKPPCERGDCGACTVLVDGVARRSCLILAPTIRNKEVLTIEGLGTAAHLHPLQKAWVDNYAVQCGFCTSGMILAAKALLDENPNPTVEEVKVALSGNFCRCTGYWAQIRAVMSAAQAMRSAR